jgi:hypothetical protein
MCTFLIPPITLPGLFPLGDAFPSVETLGYCRGLNRVSDRADFPCGGLGLGCAGFVLRCGGSSVNCRASETGRENPGSGCCKSGLVYGGTGLVRAYPRLGCGISGLIPQKPSLVFEKRRFFLQTKVCFSLMNLVFWQTNLLFSGKRVLFSRFKCGMREINLGFS